MNEKIVNFFIVFFLIVTVLIAYKNYRSYRRDNNLLSVTKKIKNYHRNYIKDETKKIYKKEIERDVDSYELREKNKYCHSRMECLKLGRKYKKNKKNNLAIKAFDVGCDFKDPNCCNELGIIFYEEKNFKYAEKYYKKACYLNNRYGCSNIAALYRDDKYGITKNNTKNITYLKKACENKKSDSCNKLGIIYEKGKIATKNLTKAKRYYLKSCEITLDSDRKFGCYNVARLAKYYLKSKDKIFIKKYFKLACSLNHKLSCDELKDIN